MNKSTISAIGIITLAAVAVGGYMLLVQSPSENDDQSEFFREEIAAENAPSTSPSIPSNRENRPPPKTADPEIERRKLREIEKKNPEAIEALEKGDPEKAAEVREEQRRESARAGSLTGANEYTIEQSWADLQEGKNRVLASRVRAMEMMLDFGQANRKIADDVAMIKAANLLDQGDTEGASEALIKARQYRVTEFHENAWELNEVLALEGLLAEMKGDSPTANKNLSRAAEQLSKANSESRRNVKARSQWTFKQVEALRLEKHGEDHEATRQARQWLAQLGG